MYCFNNISSAFFLNRADQPGSCFKLVMWPKLHPADEMNRSMIFKLIIRNSSLGTRCKIAHTWIPQSLTNVNIGLGHGLVPSGNKPLPEPADLGQCWPTGSYMLPYDVTRPLWVTYNTVFYSVVMLWVPFLKAPGQMKRLLAGRSALQAYVIVGQLKWLLNKYTTVPDHLLCLVIQWKLTLFLRL